ncbi:DUF3375 domain-containing protein [Spongisporangium articulatum]|uniref:DUF3375 domain-containing protein n=1 Tax=Spongisporangium articulatum TaxID=3362603 RepID=A0ABW8ANN3_9ACTN
MSQIVGEIARVSGAFDQPTLRLLHRADARVVIAVFRSAFPRDVRSVPAAQLHGMVETYTAELRSAQVPSVPDGTGRELCLRWMHGQWLVRSIEDDGTEVYTLTSHARDALELVAGLMRERAHLSEHRVATIVSAARRFNTEVNPDRWARLEILDKEIARLQADKDRLLAGEEVAEVSDDYMLEGYGELLALVAGLPGDFARVEEAFTSLRGQILASFRQEERPAGAVVDDYLRRVENLTKATAEGRAFEGAFTLLRDDELLVQMTEDLQALLTHPKAQEILGSDDRRELRGTVSLIRRGMESVLNQRTRVTRALREYITTHNVARDRELDATLRQLDAELQDWLGRSGPRAHVELALIPGQIELDHLRERFHNPAEERPAPGLRDVSAERPEEVSLRELRELGGPNLGRLRHAVREALESGTPAASLGELFAGLDDSLRRPVEILGLLHVAANTPGLPPPGEGRESYVTVRPDGTRREFLVPVVPLPARKDQKA